MKAVDFLGSVTMLKEDGIYLPLYVKFQHKVDSYVETDEAEVILAYPDGFGITGYVNTLPQEWQMSDPDVDGNALFKVPPEACIDFNHRRLRKRRYVSSIALRQAS